MTEPIAPIPTTDVAVETSTSDSPLVVKPVQTVKPYDDELFNAYGEENDKGEGSPSEGDTEKTSEKEVPKVEPEKEDGEKKPDDTVKTESEKASETLEKTPVKKVINGKEVEFTVQDAINAYVGQEEFNRNMDKRINHVKHLEKRWEQDQGRFKDKIGKVVEAAQNGDVVTALRAIAKIATAGTGLDTVEFEKKYFAQLDKVHDVYTKMTPEQQEAYWAKRQAADAKAKAEKLEEDNKKTTEISQLQEKVTALQQRHGVSEQEFWSNFKVLKDSEVGEGKTFQSANDITAEEVINYVYAVRHETKVFEAGKKLGIDDDTILDEVSRITRTDPTLTIDDIVKIIEKSGIATNASPEAVENLNRKAQKSGAQFSKASSTKKQNGIPEGYDEETLSHLYRNQPKVYKRPVR